MVLERQIDSGEVVFLDPAAVAAQIEEDIVILLVIDDELDLAGIDLGVPIDEILDRPTRAPLPDVECSLDDSVHAHVGAVFLDSEVAEQRVPCLALEIYIEFQGIAAPYHAVRRERMGRVRHEDPVDRQFTFHVGTVDNRPFERQTPQVSLIQIGREEDRAFGYVIS